MTIQRRSRGQAGLTGLFLALLIVALVVTACAPAKPVSPTAAPAPTKAPAPTAGQAAGPARPTSSAPTATTQSARRPDLPMGVDADGNFYRGDPNAPVKLVEFSDFQ